MEYNTGAAIWNAFAEFGWLFRSPPLTFDRTVVQSVVECRGEHAAHYRFATGDSGFADFANACCRANARLGRCAAHSAGVERSAADWPGVTLSGAAPAGIQRLDQGRLG